VEGNWAKIQEKPEAALVLEALFGKSQKGGEGHSDTDTEAFMAGKSLWEIWEIQMGGKFKENWGHHLGEKVIH